MLELSRINGFRRSASLLIPKLQAFLRIKHIDQEVEDFFLSMVKQNMELREKSNVTRKDFFQLLVQLRNTGTIQMDGEWDTKITSNLKDKQLSINECAAQCFVFFGAGFETTASAMAFCLYELAKNQHCQRALQQEIDQVLKKYNGHITFESLADMKYLECCIDGEYADLKEIAFR